jgi:hypothetical protein
MTSKTESGLWITTALLSAALATTGVLLLDAQKRYKVARTVAQEAIDLVRNGGGTPPGLVELAVNQETGDAMVRVDQQHIYRFPKACRDLRPL